MTEIVQKQLLDLEIFKEMSYDWDEAGFKAIDQMDIPRKQAPGLRDKEG